MTVQELVVELQKQDPEALVIAPSSNFELHGANTDAIVCGLVIDRVSETFTDAFDREDYSKSIYRRGSTFKAVRIYGR